MSDVFAETPIQIATEISKLLQLSGALRSVPQAKTEVPNYKAAIAAYDTALRETVQYMEKMKSGQVARGQEDEWRLSKLWSQASVAIADFDPQLANRCFIKGQGWLNPAVWGDQRYQNYRIGIDDMRQALMELHEKHFAGANRVVPNWFPIAGVGFAIATFLSLFYLLLGPDLSPQKRVIFDAWIAFCVAASAAFLGGFAAASGTLKVPFMKDTPIKFSAIGGIAVFVVVLLIMLAANR
jgi:hypothetical protein